MSRTSASFTLVLWSLAAFAAYVLSARAADPPRSGAANALELICVTEQPAIVEGESAALKAWASTPDGEPIGDPLTFVWDVKEGRIVAQDSQVRWDLSAVKVDPREGVKRLTATVTASAPSYGNARCAVEVFVGRKEVALPDRGAIRGESLLSARRYLLPGASEQTGYGLYSYLLFSAPPNGQEETARYLKTIEACLLVIQDVEDFLARHVRPSRLNATYIPLKKSPAPGASNADWAANVLAAYDYAAAQILLGGLDKSYTKGPYLISTLKPLSDASQPAHQVEDLTGVVPDLAQDWVKQFTYLAAQERSWSEESLQRIGLRLRNVIAVGGKVAPETLQGLAKLIVFKHGG